jgi:bacillolysin
MKHAVRVVLAALVVIIALGIISVSVETQDRGRGPVRFATNSAQDLRDWDVRLSRLERSGELAVRKSEADTMLPGRMHEHLVQLHKGVPVFGADVTRQSRAGAALSVFGSLYTNIGIDVAPTLGEDEAAAVFARETGVTPSASARPHLMVLPKDDGTFVLTYRVSQFTGAELPVMFINARTGAVELRYNNLKTASAVGKGRGVLGDEKKVSVSVAGGGFSASDEMRPPDLITFDMRGNLARVKQVLDYDAPLYTSDVAFDSDNDWGDAVAVDAHAYLGWVYDYWFKRFGRKGMDDRNGGIYAMIHPVSRTDALRLSSSDFGLFAVNAFWCGGCGPLGRGIMVFGDGLPPGYYLTPSGQYFNYFAGSLDVVAHELGHALTDASSDLVYLGESGALNEAFSDVLGISARFYYRPAGTASLQADYTVGRDIVTPVLPGSKYGIRSLADPASFGQPDHYSKRSVGPLDQAHDWGYVHQNSTIGGHAFYLAIEGGTNRTSGLSVQGVGGANREQIEKVFYRAFAYFLPSDASFSTARAATVRAAQELYGSGSAAERAITQAWSAVGVY